MHEHHVVYNPEGLDYEFDGEILINIENDVEIGTVIIYRSDTGKYIMRQTKLSRPGVLVLNKTIVFDSKEDLAECMGFSKEAKAIWGQLGVKTSKSI